MQPLPRKPTSLEGYARMLWRRFDEDRCLQIASSLTFTTLLAIVPIVTVTLTVIAAFPVFGEAIGHVQKFIIANMLPESAETIASYAEEFSDNAAKLTAVGIFFLFVTSVIVLMTIDRALNQIWRVPQPRTPIQRVFIYWALLTVGPILIGASLSMTSWLVSLSLGLVGGITWAGAGLLRVVPVLLTAIACSLLYLTMPNRRVLLRDAFLGGLLAAIAFEIMKAAFAIYVTQFATYKLVYGAFASLPIFLLWIYLSWVVVLFGAIVAAVGPEWRERAWQIEPVPGVAFIDALHILKLLNNARATGNTLTLAQLQSTLKLPAAHVDAILEAMSKALWVGKVGAGWTMVRDPALIRVADVYHLFVFREGMSHRTGQAAAELDVYARQLEGRIEEILQLSLEELFSQREPAAAAVSPIRLLERGERAPS